MGGHVARMGDGRRAHTFLLGKLEEKHLRGRPKIRWENSRIWDFKELDYESDWKTFAQDGATWCAYVLEAIPLHKRFS